MDHLETVIVPPVRDLGEGVQAETEFIPLPE
jgi:hypothetical protein